MGVDGGLLSGEPSVDMAFELVERDDAFVEEGEIEGFEVEGGAEFLTGLIAKGEDGEAAGIVAGELAGHHGDTVNKVIGAFWSVLAGGHEVVDGLLPGPVHGVEAGIDDHAVGGPDAAEDRGVGILVYTVFLAQTLGVAGPALRVGGVADQTGEGIVGQELAGKGDLQMVAGNGLVDDDDLGLGAGFGLPGA